MACRIFGIIAGMSMHRSVIAAVLLISEGFLPAQDAPAPSAPAQTEMQKWLATTDEGWQAAFKRDVVDAHEAEVNKLKLQYLNLLEEAVAKVSKANDLDGAVALRKEQKRFSDTEFFPETDEAGDAAPVKQARATLRTLLAQAEKNHAARAKALLAKYDAYLADAQVQLTKVQRLDDAVLVKNRRDEVAAAWSRPAAASPADAAAAQPPKVPVTPPKAPAAKQPSATAKAATKGDIIKVLVGKWHFHWTETGFDADFQFKADGTFTWNPGGKGTWTVADDKIVLEVSGQQAKTMQLPLDPAGTKVHDQRKNRNVVAVKTKE